MKRTTSALIVVAVATFAGCEARAWTPTGTPAEPITEISQRYFNISTWGVTLRADGTATRLCILPADGTYTVEGRIASEDFRTLAAFVERVGFFELEPAYGGPGSFGSALTSVVRGGIRYDVRSDGRNDPPALPQIRDLLDRAAEQIPCGQP
jgi:hypothetical protein